MNIEELDKKLQKIQNDLSIETDKIMNLSKNISEQSFDDPIDEIKAKDNYYSYLDPCEKLYQQQNDEYKKLISGYSEAYLEICDFYVGPDLPRATFLDSKDDITTLYFLFMMGLFLKI